MDALAEEVLLQAEQLTANLEVAAFATALHVINVAGRQRMLSQRLAKEALLGALLGEGGAAPDTRAELEAGFGYLAALPLTNAGVAEELARASSCWDQLRDALRHPGTAAGQAGIAASSEALLTHLDRLTEQLERGMQALVR